MNQREQYQSAWKQAAADAEKELEYLFAKVEANDYEFLNQGQDQCNFFITKCEPKQDPVEDYEDPDDGLDDQSDTYENNQDQHSPRATTTTKEEFTINQEITKELIKEIEFQGEITQIYRIQYQNGDMYEGELIGDLKEGSGIYYYESGEKYDGLFQDDCIHGYGKYYFLGGHKYEGEWQEGLKYGYGILEFTTGDKYYGDFKNDTYEGQGNNILESVGVFQYANGDRYEGEWKQGKKHGQGEMRTKDKHVLIGQWVDDELQPF